jgi:hypothetical protein
MAFNSLDLFQITVALMPESENGTETAICFLVARTIAATLCQEWSSIVGTTAK